VEKRKRPESDPQKDPNTAPCVQNRVASITSSQKAEQTRYSVRANSSLETMSTLLSPPCPFFHDRYAGV
jgi:hypothetical protein